VAATEARQLATEHAGSVVYRGGAGPLVFLFGALSVAVATAVIVKFPFAQAVWLLAGVGLCVAAVILPKLGLALAVLAITLSPEIPVAGLEIRLEDVVLCAVVAGWAMRRLARRESALPNPLIAPVIAYLTVGIVATAWGGLRGTVSLTAIDQLSGATFHALKRLEFALFFIVLADTLGSVADIKRFTYLLMAGLTTLNLYGLQRFLQTGWIAEAPVGAPGHEVGFGSMLLVALALGLLSGKVGRGVKTLAVGSLGLALAVLPLSQGRNSTLTAAMLVVGFLYLKRQPLILLLPAAIWAAMRLYPAHIVDRLITLRWLLASEVDPQTLGGAVAPASFLWRLQPPLYFASQALFTSPLIGMGLAAIPLGFIDNEYAIQFYYTGMVGLAVFGWLVVFLARLVKHLARDSLSDPFAGSFVAACAYAFSGYAISSLVSPTVSAARPGGLFFLLIGLLTALYRVHWRAQNFQLGMDRSPAA
jgi:hypothetical protein